MRPAKEAFLTEKAEVAGEQDQGLASPCRSWDRSRVGRRLRGLGGPTLLFPLSVEMW